MAGGRTNFSDEDDLLLVKYIARYNPDKSGRQGNALYQKLEANEDEKWKWASRHPWRSWRERYKKQQPWFDQRIKAYQRKKGIESKDPTKVVVGKKAARRRDAVDEGQTEQEEEDQLRESESEVDKARAVEKKGKKRIRVEEEEDRKRKKSKKQEEASTESEAIELTQDKKGPACPLNKPAACNSSIGQPHGDSGEEEHQSIEKREEPAGSDDDAAEIFGRTEGGDADVFQDDDKEVDDIVTERPTSSHQGVASRLKQSIISPSKPTVPTHNTPNDSGPLYPDLSNLPPPFVASPGIQGRLLPGEFDPPNKDEPLSQDNLAPETSPQNPQPSQEPTPPLSNVEDRSPGQNISGHPLLNERQGRSKEHSSRHLMLPASNDTVDFPVRYQSSEVDVAAQADGIVRTKLKLKLKKRRRSAGGSDNSNFFESIPPTPDPNQEVKMGREPPQLVEGPFGSALTSGRGKAPRSATRSESSEDEGDEHERATRSDEKVWPPRRAPDDQMDVNGGGQVKEDGWVAPRQTLISRTRTPATVETVSHGVPPKSHRDHHPFTQPTQEYEAVMARYFAPRHFAPNENDAEASLLDDPHHPFSQPSQAVNRYDSITGYKHITSTSHTPMQPRKNHRTFVESLPDPDCVATGSTHPKSTESRGKRVYIPSHRVMVEASAAASLSTGPSSRIGFSRSSDHDLLVSNVKAPKFPLPREASRSSSSDPFVVSKASDRRYDPEGDDKEATLPNDDNDRPKTFGGLPVIPKIDLTLCTKRPHRRIFLPPRQSLPAPRLAAEMEEDIPLRRASAPVEDPNAPRSASSTPSNMSIADHSIAVRLGVDAALQKMSDNHGFTLDVIRRLYNLIGDFQRTDTALMRMRKSAEVEATSYINTDVNQVDERPRSSRNSSPRRVSYRLPGLEYTPVPVDTLTDYSPPETSRAGQYARLARQGRRHEALKQEGRNVSSGRTGTFLQKIRMSEDGSPLATSSAPQENIDRRLLESVSVSVDHVHTAAVGLASQSPQEHIWGDEEDRQLRSGDPVVLKELEAKMGKASFKQRIAEIYSAPS